MRRRDFVTLIVMVAAATRPLRVLAQSTSKKTPVVGVLWHAADAEEEDVYLSVLQKAFHHLGYVEGNNIVLEHRFPAENPDRFRTLARELVDAKPDAIIAVTALGAVELKKLTDTIPIVFVLAADPVGFGLVQSLAHPGGNATGPSLMTIDLSGKRLELFKEAVPNLSRVAILMGVTDPFRDRTVKAYQASGERLGLSMWPVEIKRPEDIEPAFSKIAQDGANGIIFGGGRSTIRSACACR
jgi:putative tryptophan/tyrosine transport system substrate-binding protein